MITEHELKMAFDDGYQAGMEAAQQHGRWLDGRPYVNSRWKVCSVCKECAPEPHGGYNYCPSCGAKMDAEVEG